MSNSRSKPANPNRKSLATIILSLVASGEIDTFRPGEPSEEDFDITSIAVFEGEGGLIPTKYEA
jgi:hypothetical protein